jgi:hypothetical protein
MVWLWVSESDWRLESQSLASGSVQMWDWWWAMMGLAVLGLQEGAKVGAEDGEAVVGALVGAKVGVTVG